MPGQEASELPSRVPGRGLLGVPPVSWPAGT